MIFIILYVISVIQKDNKHKRIKLNQKTTHPFNFRFTKDGRSGGHLIRFDFLNNGTLFNSSENVNSYSFKTIENNFSDSMIVVFDSTDPKTNVLLYKIEDFNSFGIIPSSYYRNLFKMRE